MSRSRRSPRQPLWLVIVVLVLGVLGWLFEQQRGRPPASTGGACGEMFAFGQPQPRTGERTTFLCRLGYATLHDDVRKVPLYSAEHLVARDLARSVTRTDDFQPDPDLPGGQRAELNDYAGSGYDRGHMAPAADATDTREMHQSFYLSNMVPQNRVMNEQIWAGLEAATRACAKRSGELFVITGPIFEGRARTVGPDRVEVPDALFKIALDARSGAYRAFLMPNAALRRTTNFSRYEVSIAEIERRSGLNFFPQGQLAEAQRGSLCADAFGG